MASCLKPETYHATTKSGKSISETAKDANTYVDYPSIEAAINDAATVIRDEVKKIADAIAKVQIGKEALCVKDKSMQPVVDEVSEYVKGLPDRGIISALDSYKEQALKVHNEKQEEYNQEAQSKVRSRANSEE